MARRHFGVSALHSWLWWTSSDLNSYLKMGRFWPRLLNHGQTLDTDCAFLLRVPDWEMLRQRREISAAPSFHVSPTCVRQQSVGSIENPSSLCLPSPHFCLSPSFAEMTLQTASGNNNREAGVWTQAALLPHRVPGSLLQTCLLVTSQSSQVVCLFHQPAFGLRPDFPTCSSHTYWVLWD